MSPPRSQESRAADATRDPDTSLVMNLFHILGHSEFGRLRATSRSVAPPASSASANASVPPDAVPVVGGLPRMAEHRWPAIR